MRERLTAPPFCDGSAESCKRERDLTEVGIEGSKPSLVRGGWAIDASENFVRKTACSLGVSLVPTFGCAVGSRSGERGVSNARAIAGGPRPSTKLEQHKHPCHAAPGHTYPPSYSPLVGRPHRSSLLAAWSCWVRLRGRGSRRHGSEERNTLGPGLLAVEVPERERRVVLRLPVPQ
jgi:hypothetical protein